MQYDRTVKLKNGQFCRLRNATANDAEAVLANFRLTHAQTDYLLSYPDEDDKTVESEAKFLQGQTDSENGIEIAAEIDGKIVGLAGFSAIGGLEKIRHRAEFGVSVDSAYWGLGIGRALTRACIELAKRAGYRQLELDAVAANERAISLYSSEGFVEYGRNPRGFCSRVTGWQEIVLMRLELD